VTEEHGAPSRPRVGWVDAATARLARLGADPSDDEELRDKKRLLVLLAVLILPVSAVWGGLYLAFGSAVGVIPYVYLAVSVGRCWSSRGRGASRSCSTSSSPTCS
jgi:hypothetical protein